MFGDTSIYFKGFYIKVLENVYWIYSTHNIYLIQGGYENIWNDFIAKRVKYIEIR